MCSQPQHILLWVHAQPAPKAVQFDAQTQTAARLHACRLVGGQVQRVRDAVGRAQRLPRLPPGRRGPRRGVCGRRPLRAPPRRHVLRSRPSQSAPMCLPVEPFAGPRHAAAPCADTPVTSPRIASWCWPPHESRTAATAACRPDKPASLTARLGSVAAPPHPPQTAAVPHLRIRLKHGLQAALALLLHEEGLVGAPPDAQRAVGAAADGKVARRAHRHAPHLRRPAPFLSATFSRLRPMTSPSRARAGDALHAASESRRRRWSALSTLLTGRHMLPSAVPDVEACQANAEWREAE